MEFTEKMQKVMECAVRLAQEGNHRYFMPEHVVYGMTFDEDFRREYEAGGGKAKRLRQDLLEFLREQAGVAAEDQEGPQMTLDVQQVFRMATEQAESSSRDAVEVSHLLSALMRLKDSFGLYYMTVQDVDLVEVLGELSRRSLSEERGSEPLMPEEPNTYETSEDPESKNSRWKNFLENMNETCRKQNPLIGRTEELERTIQILCRKDKNNVLHIGEPGVGKTALAYGLAQKIEDGQVPEPLKQAVLYALDLGGLLAGTQYRGDFEKRFKEIIDGLEKEAQPILYLDEIHNIVGAGAVNGGSLDVANLLKPYLAAGHIRFIGATTYEEYKKHFSGQRSLVRRFQNVDIQEPTKEEAVEILKGLKPGYERFHGVRYRAGVLEHAVEVSSRYINERFLPDKAIDLIDEAGAFRKLHPQEQKIQTVNKTLIDEVLSKTCSIPAQTVEKGETEKLALLEGNIRKQIFGQDEAAAQVVNVSNSPGQV